MSLSRRDLLRGLGGAAAWRVATLPLGSPAPAYGSPLTATTPAKRFGSPTGSPTSMARTPATRSRP